MPKEAEVSIILFIDTLIELIILFLLMENTKDMRIVIFVSFLLSGFISYSQSFIPDTAINRIALVDSISVRHILGTSCWNAVIEDSEIIKAIVYNTGKDEKLELIFHEGNDKYAFSEFRVLQGEKGFNDTKQKSLQLNANHFESSRGIRLGLNSKTVEERLGWNLERKNCNNGKLVLFIRIEADNDIVFKKFNMPIYFGEYVFQNDKLIEFSFGFENP